MPCVPGTDACAGETMDLDSRRSATRARSNSLASKLRLSILRGDIAPDAKLSLDQLRVTYGVSLSPIREALTRLAAEGIVIAEKGKGFRAPSASVEGETEICTLRCNLESLALSESIRLGAKGWEQRLVLAYHELGKHEADDGRGTRNEEWELIHREFHEALISACGMPVLLQFCSILHDLSDRYRRIFLARYPRDRNIRGEHEAIFKAAIARDAAAAVMLLRRHVERTAMGVQRAMQSMGHQSRVDPATRRRPRLQRGRHPHPQRA